jgi:hypothetical protein
MIPRQLLTDSVSISSQLRSQFCCYSAAIVKQFSTVIAAMRCYSVAIPQRLRSDYAASTQRFHSDPTTIANVRIDCVAISLRFRCYSAAFVKRFSTGIAAIAPLFRSDSTAITQLLRSDSTVIPRRLLTFHIDGVAISLRFRCYSAFIVKRFSTVIAAIAPLFRSDCSPSVQRLRSDSMAIVANAQ